MNSGGTGSVRSAKLTQAVVGIKVFLVLADISLYMSARR